MGDGTGAVMLDGKMEDDASVKQCQVMVDLAEQLADARPRARRRLRLLTAADGLTDGRRPTTLRPRRSVLYMPGANERALEKAKGLAADALILDLEDAVAPDAKAEARDRVCAAVAVGRVRPPRRSRSGSTASTPSGTPTTSRAVAEAGPAGVVVPKVNSVADVARRSRRRLEAGRRARPHHDLGDARDADRHAPRRGDRRRVASGSPCSSWAPTTWPRSCTPSTCPAASRCSPGSALCLLAARAAGKVILDGVYNDIKDADGLRRRVRAGPPAGLRRQDADPPEPGRAVQPTCSPPSDDEIDEAREIIAAFEEATAAGKGVVTVNGRMIENLHVDNARRAIAQAEAIDVRLTRALADARLLGLASPIRGRIAFAAPPGGLRGARDTRSCRRALPPDAHRDRVARAARLRHDHQQPVRELGRRPAARRPRASTLDLDELLLCYGDHLGDPVLREAVAAGGDGLRARRRARHARARPRRCSRGHLAARAGRPRRGRAHQLRHQPRDAARDRRRRSTSSTSRFDDGWRLDVDRLAALRAARRHEADQRHLPAQPDRHDVRPRRRCTRWSSWPSAPGAVLLVDETYRDLTHGEPLPLAATLSPRAVSVASMSKAYGLPGLRVGWAVVPRPASSPRRCSRPRSRS